jgi:hypothetical protein
MTRIERRRNKALQFRLVLLGDQEIQSQMGPTFSLDFPALLLLFAAFHSIGVVSWRDAATPTTLLNRDAPRLNGSFYRSSGSLFGPERLCTVPTTRWHLVLLSSPTLSL